MIQFIISLILIFFGLGSLSSGASNWNNPYTRGRAIESFIIGTIILLMVVFV